MTALFIISGILGVGILLVNHGTIFKTRWVINKAAQFKCPTCHKMHGEIRIPHNLRQTL